ncbi:bifunctional phosphoribosylaminoimidazolecarboxamide formyltransferase/IMP cyclohydrolase [Candidatus Woesearchaeota archaeon]|nr:bifunctional phosphoribosylaminoimidazolecarboxamide formyltransferase/IMP cyclohydrolase [Candidatus Woesearchaeota archaeon]
MVKTALISVSNKEGIVELAKVLAKLDVEILSTGGTSELLKKNGIKVTDVSSYTGFPEMMSGRVKTLHPKIHGGILALRSSKEHLEAAKKHGIKLIDLVVVNLYPFKETIMREDLHEDEAIEQIDIGGPSMIRSAAKNFQDVLVVVDQKDYAVVGEMLREGSAIGESFRKALATKAFRHTAKYDTLIGNYLSEENDEEKYPQTLTYSAEKLQDLRYGENPHQKAAFYKDELIFESCIPTAKQLWGKELSYNNILDSDAAFELIKEFKEPACAVIKHANPCGVAERNSIEGAFAAAYGVDPKSAFGCILALNRDCTKKLAEELKGKFVEVLIAPSYEKGAVEYLKANKKDLRIIETGPLTKSQKGFHLKKVVGGVLVQSRNWPDVDSLELRAVTKRKPNAQEIEDMKFAWKVCKHTKSNSVIFAKDKTAYGLGVGQMSRVDSSIIAAYKSAGRAKGGVLSSDAFFPFRDGVDEAHKAGIKAIIQPGGSIRDQEVIDAANDHGMSMVFTGVRLFRH